MPDKAFNVFHTEWQEWVNMLEWQLKYDEPLSAESVMSALVSEGFILTPPARKRYQVKYNGKLIFEMDKPGSAAHLGPGYEIIDTEQEGKEMNDRLTDKVRERWPELVEADAARNGGSMPMELFSVEGYARMDNVTPEQYIADVLRRERERRQALDEIVRETVMLDEQIDAAAAQGISIIDYLTQYFNDTSGNGHTFRPEDISAFYLRKLLQRMEERAQEVGNA